MADILPPAAANEQPPTPIPSASCPACAGPAVQGEVRDLSATEHVGTYVCKLGHLWITKWFATERSA